MEEVKESKKLQSNTTFNNEFSQEIYEHTYKYGDEDINGTQLRVAKDLASIEEDSEYWTEKFLHILEDFKFVPGGRITSNAGTGLKGTTYINCFVDGFVGDDQDSMEGILDTLRRQALILKSEGGYGFCADVMRPRGAFVGGIGNESPGAVKMLDMWDTQSEVITAGSGKKSSRKNAKQKIRKGAQMVTMSCWHPDIEEFITSKQTPGRLTKFNMSVLVTDELMEAAKNNQPWNLEFPDYEKRKDEYKNEWNGNLKEWKALGYETVVFKTFENANELWDVIMQSTYNRNEPGVLFVDTMNRLNNLYYSEYISATNPCGEQLLPIGGVCLLGSLNLTQFVNDTATGWDYDKLGDTIPTAVRFMDNVNDKTNVPLPIQKKNLQDKRRIGLGILGYGSALMMMKLRYGSEKALELTNDLMTFIANTAYQASAQLAKEKGTFNLYDEDKYMASKFVANLSDETKALMRKNGMRNSHLLSIQPTGNSSVYANNVSGGLEPIFLPEYVRTTIFPFPPEGLEVAKNIDFQNRKFDSVGTEWSWTTEGDENLLRTEFDGYVWKIDKNRGLLRETVVRDYAVRYLDAKGEWDPSAEWVATTTELSIDEHVKTMGVMARYIDSAMSKTVNLPADYSYGEFKRLYEDVYATGVIKGCTTYRAGTMTTVLAEKKDEDGELSLPRTTAPERPKTLDCDIHHLTVGGGKWIVIVGLYGEDPYEIFAFQKKNISISTKIRNGKLTKVKRGRYNLELGDFELENLKEHFESNEEEALTRMISTALRHGTDINFIYEQLQKSEGTIVSFSKAIARTLKKYLDEELLKNSETYCENCGDPDGLHFSEGCFQCKSCGYSKCT